MQSSSSKKVQTRRQGTLVAWHTSTAAAPRVGLLPNPELHVYAVTLPSSRVHTRFPTPLITRCLYAFTRGENTGKRSTFHIHLSTRKCNSGDEAESRIDSLISPVSPGHTVNVQPQDMQTNNLHCPKKNITVLNGTPLLVN